TGVEPSRGGAPELARTDARGVIDSARSVRPPSSDDSGPARPTPPIDPDPSDIPLLLGGFEQAYGWRAVHTVGKGRGRVWGKSRQVRSPVLRLSVGGQA